MNNPLLPENQKKSLRTRKYNVNYIIYYHKKWNSFIEITVKIINESYETLF